MSKIFERYIFRQLHSFMFDFLLKYQCSFRTGHSTQHCLLTMLEKGKSAVDKGKSFGALLMHLTVFLTNFCLLNFMPMDLAFWHRG